MQIDYAYLAAVMGDRGLELSTSRMSAAEE